MIHWQSLVGQIVDEGAKKPWSEALKALFSIEGVGSVLHRGQGLLCSNSPLDSLLFQISHEWGAVVTWCSLFVKSAHISSAVLSLNKIRIRPVEYAEKSPMPEDKTRENIKWLQLFKSTIRLRHVEGSCRHQRLLNSRHPTYYRWNTVGKIQIRKWA